MKLTAFLCAVALTASTAHASPSPTAQVLHESDVLALKILVQLAYFKNTEGIKIEKVGNRTIAINDTINSLVGGVGLLATMGGVASLESHRLSFRGPGVYQQTEINPSSIIGEPSFTRTIRVTPYQAYSPFAIYGAATVAGITSSVLAGSRNTPLADATARKIMGFDSKLGAMAQTSVKDLSNILNLTVQQRQRLTDAMVEDLAKQVDVAQRTTKSFQPLAENANYRIDIDVLKIAARSGLVSQTMLKTLKDVSGLVMGRDAIDELSKTKILSPTDIQHRLAAMEELNEILTRVQAEKPEARTALQGLQLRTTLAVSTLKNLK